MQFPPPVARRYPWRRFPVSAQSWLQPKRVVFLAAAVAVFFATLPTHFTAGAEENLWLDVARASVTADELLRHVGVLADDIFEGRETGSRGGRAAAKYIAEKLKEAGLQPAGPNQTFVQPFSGNSQNLLALLPGKDPDVQGETLIIGAHYDHVGYGTRRNSYGPRGYIHNGADDNASGVAALLEVIDAVMQTGYQPRRSMLFAFWDGEEKGLLGSKHWVSSPTVSLKDVRLALNIDMVGRLDGGRIEVGGTRTGRGLRHLMSSPQLSETTWLDFSWEYKENGDHWTFFQAGVPSLYVHTGLHDDYHRPSDDVEKLNIEGMREVTQYLVEQICELADAEQLPDFRSEATLDTPQTRRRQEKTLPALSPRLGFDWKILSGKNTGPSVKRVHRQSAAGRAGLKRGDRIVSADNLPCTEPWLLPAIALTSPAELTLEIERAGTDMPLALVIPLQGAPIRLGLSWREDPAEHQSVYVTRVVPYSAAARAGIKLHDRICALDRESINGSNDLLVRMQALLAEGRDNIVLKIESRGALREVMVPLGAFETSRPDATL
ncbi:MAG: M20/M25/M40 family metallo-hydrolase [Pirellulales bacterium]|nr:M20/M25/M40 family metallo-hydrolase [Pirellulales bacterium]